MVDTPSPPMEYDAVLGVDPYQIDLKGNVVRFGKVP
jgi:hypothetical protein